MSEEPVAVPREEEEDDVDDGGDLAALDKGEGKAERVRRFTTHVFRKTPTAGHGHVLAWGWMMKQGQGGLLHRKNWKRRFFSLYSVPQGSVFVYYDKQSVSGDDILGFIDLRKATEVRSATKTINKAETQVMEIITPSRTYSLAPLTVHKRLTAPMVPKLQFILGWPVPEPSFGEELVGDTAESAARVFSTWTDIVAIQIEAERVSRKFDVETVADSTDTLPPRLTLRCTPTDLALLDVDDHDQSRTCWSYRDIASWSCPIPSELHVQVRIPAAMVRCVFKCDSAMEIKTLIENHVAKIVSNQGK